MRSSQINELDLANIPMVLDEWATRNIPTSPPRIVSNIVRPTSRSAAINGRELSAMSVELTDVEEKLTNDAS